jgi:hypothetical protein
MSKTVEKLYSENRAWFDTKESIEFQVEIEKLRFLEGIERALFLIAEHLDDIRKHGIEQLSKPQGA